MAPKEMRLTALSLACVLLMLPSLARANPPRLHLTVAPLQLAQLAQLQAPALGASSRAGPAFPGVTPAVPSAPKQPKAYLGNTWQLTSDVELSLHLTPNEAHCAPLARLTF